MASGVKPSKFISDLFRKRLASTYGLAEPYRPSINRHKDKLIELIKEKAEIASQSGVVKKLRKLKGFYTLEMAPPTSAQELAVRPWDLFFNFARLGTYASLPSKLKADIVLTAEFFKNGCYKYLTVKQAWLLFLVCVEVSLWFFLGETIGKMKLIGYRV